MSPPPMASSPISSTGTRPWYETGSRNPGSRSDRAPEVILRPRFAASMWTVAGVRRSAEENAMDIGLSGSRALVGGGRQGLGAAIASALAAEGARVAITSRSPDRLLEHASRIGGVAIAADLSTEEGPLVAVNGAVERLGGLD